MQIYKRKGLLCMAACMVIFLAAALIIPSMASNSQRVSYIASLDKNTIYVSDEEQTVTMTVRSNKTIDLDAMGMTVNCPSGIRLGSIANEEIGLPPESINPENGRINYATEDAENTQTSEIVTVTYTIPANTPAGNYKVGISDLAISKDYGEMWENKGFASINFRIKEKDAPLPPSRFTDVPEDAYYAVPVAFAVENGITNGMGDNEFCPDSDCTRAQVVTFLWRAAGSPEVEADDRFRDIEKDSYYEKAVAWAVASGITNGMGDDEFAPDYRCTRGQIVTFLSRMAKAGTVEAVNPFTDVAEDAYYYNAVLWAVEKKITNGMGDNEFCPEMNCTRGQIVTFIYRFMNQN